MWARRRKKTRHRGRKARRRGREGERARDRERERARVERERKKKPKTMDGESVGQAEAEKASSTKNSQAVHDACSHGSKATAVGRRNTISLVVKSIPCNSERLHATCMCVRERDCETERPCVCMRARVRAAPREHACARVIACRDARTSAWRWRQSAKRRRAHPPEHVHLERLVLRAQLERQRRDKLPRVHARIIHEMAHQQ
eukprot:6197622-Pleurochrysis_carterae.AAC.4